MADDDATGWFEPLYAAASEGRGEVPWDGNAASALLAAWLQDGDGRAVVVGCGLGDDADLVASRGWRTVAFDVAPTAVRMARERFPESAVEWVVADLLELPSDWLGAFDLVVEHYTVQALPVRVRAQATAAVTSLVAPGGRLIVLAGSADDDASPDRPGPPWPLTRAELDGFAAGPLEPVRTESADGHETWRAEFARPSVR